MKIWGKPTNRGTADSTIDTTIKQQTFHYDTYLESFLDKEKTTVSGFLREGKGAHLYKEYRDSWEYWPEEVQLAMLLHNQELKQLIQSLHPDLVIDMGVGDGVTLAHVLQSVALRENGKLPPVSLLDISDENIALAKQTIKQHHLPISELDRYGLDFKKAWKLFSHKDFSPKLVLNLWFWFGNFESKKLQERDQEILTDARDRLLFTFFGVPRDVDAIKKTEDAYDTPWAQKFVKHGVANLFSQFPVVVGTDDVKKEVDDAKYEVTYNVQKQQIEVALRFANGFCIKRPGKKDCWISAGESYIVHISKRYTQQQVTTLMQSTGKRVTDFIVDKASGVTFALADNKPQRRKQTIKKVAQSGALALSLLLASRGAKKYDHHQKSMQDKQRIAALYDSLTNTIKETTVYPYNNLRRYNTNADGKMTDKEKYTKITEQANYIMNIYLPCRYGIDKKQVDTVYVQKKLYDFLTNDEIQKEIKYNYLMMSGGKVIFNRIAERFYKKMTPYFESITEESLIPNKLFLSYNQEFLNTIYWLPLDKKGSVQTQQLHITKEELIPWGFFYTTHHNRKDNRGFSVNGISFLKRIFDQKTSKWYIMATYPCTLPSENPAKDFDDNNYSLNRGRQIAMNYMIHNDKKTQAFLDIYEAYVAKVADRTSRETNTENIIMPFLDAIKQDTTDHDSQESARAAMMSLLFEKSSIQKNGDTSLVVFDEKPLIRFTKKTFCRELIGYEDAIENTMQEWTNDPIFENINFRNMREGVHKGEKATISYLGIFIAMDGKTYDLALCSKTEWWKEKRYILAMKADDDKENQSLTQYYSLNLAQKILGDYSKIHKKLR